jgi:hypothetical protein
LFDFLSRRAGQAGRVDKASFGAPLSKKGMKRFGVGEPVFLRLKRPPPLRNRARAVHDIDAGTRLAIAPLGAAAVALP